jgi:hypothetical protein
MTITIGLYFINPYYSKFFLKKCRIQAKSALSEVAQGIKFLRGATVPPPRIAACETFHKARLPGPFRVDIFPREQPRTVLAQASGALLKP